MPGRSDEAIRIRAYEIWLAEGQPHGRDWEHWVRAVAEIDETEVPAKKGGRKAAGKKDKPAKAETVEAGAGEEPATAAAKQAKKAAAKPVKAAKAKTAKAGKAAAASEPDAGTSLPEAALAVEAAPEQGSAAAPVDEAAKEEAPKKRRTAKAKTPA